MQVTIDFWTMFFICLCSFLSGWYIVALLVIRYKYPMKKITTKMYYNSGVRVDSYLDRYLVWIFSPIFAISHLMYKLVYAPTFVIRRGLNHILFGKIK